MTITPQTTTLNNQIRNVLALRMLKKILELNEFENKICKTFNANETTLSYITSDLLEIFIDITGISQLDDERIDYFYDQVFNKIDSSDDDLGVFLNEFIESPDTKL